MPYPLASLIDLLRWQAARHDPAPVGTPPARLTYLSTNDARGDGESPGRPTGGAISDDDTE